MRDEKKTHPNLEMNMTTYEHDLKMANKIDRHMSQGYTGVATDKILGLPEGTSYHTMARGRKKGLSTYHSVKGMEKNTNLVAGIKVLWEAGFNWVQIDKLLSLPKLTSGHIYIRLGRPWVRR